MPVVAKNEVNWRLLFDIALGYGDSVSTLQITFPGFMSFLEAADLLNVKTGVCPLVIERMWGQHSTHYHAPSSGTALFDDSISHLDKPQARKRRASYDIKRQEILKLGVCHFEGFTDMMNVVCVRCYQCWKCSDLYVKEHETMADAIILSAEDLVALPESVKFTAQRYFKPFIFRNIICRSTKLILNPMRNEWTQHTNVVVAHVIGSLLRSVVLPLFQKYATKGLILQEDFNRLILDVFPEFNAVQSASAASIFKCPDFFDASVLLASSRIPLFAEKTASMSLESFVEALLMLGVVLYSDESAFPHHRSITAKVWFAFENVYCRALERIAMAEEIVFSSRPQSISPIISFAFPFVVPVERVTSFVIGGLNLAAVSPITEDAPGHPLTALMGGRLIVPMAAPEQPSLEVSDAQADDSLLFDSPVKSESSQRKPASEQPADAAKDTNVSPAVHPSSDVAAPGEVPSADGSTVNEGDTTVEHPVHNIGVTEVATTASKLGNREFEAKSFSSFDSPIYGTRVCRVYMNEMCVHCIDHGNNYAEVVVPQRFTDIQDYHMQVEFEENATASQSAFSESCSISRYVFTPSQRVSVSLRNDDGTEKYSSMDILLQTTSVYQVIPSTHVQRLHEVFNEEAQKDVLTGTETLLLSQFPAACKKLGLVTAGKALVACQAAIQNYFAIVTECDLSTLAVEKNGKLPLDRLQQEGRVPFNQFVCIIAQLCIRQAGTTTQVPNVVNFISAALAKKGGDGALGGQASSDRMSPSSVVGGSSVLPTIPYCALIEVPYQNAMRKTKRGIEECNDAAESFLSNARSVGTEEMKLSGICAKLPPFPTDVAVDAAVSQYEGDEMSGLAKDIYEVSMKIQEQFMLEEIVIKPS